MFLTRLGRHRDRYACEDDSTKEGRRGKDALGAQPLRRPAAKGSREICDQQRLCQMHRAVDNLSQQDPTEQPAEGPSGLTRDSFCCGPSEIKPDRRDSALDLSFVAFGHRAELVTQ
jgi:hypothetical protein